MNATELVDRLEKLKSLIRTASFDGWIENDGPNCDQDGECQLLKESDALAAIDEVFKVSVTVEKIDGDPVSYLLKRAQSDVTKKT